MVRKFSFEELLGEILKEGLFWAALGRPSEVMPFLRGKLLSNGIGMDRMRREYLEYLLDDLERFYKRVSWSDEIDERHWRALRSFHRDIISVISSERA